MMNEITAAAMFWLVSFQSPCPRKEGERDL
jgi:hypothetical protein